MTKEPLSPHPVLRDEQTIQYFDDYLPDYSGKHSKHLEDTICSVVDQFGKENSSLVDIGGGTGSLLRKITANTRIKDVSVIDVSQKGLDECAKSVRCQTYLGSICDREFVEQIPRRFDFAVVSCVLHHLIGKSRKQSLLFAAQAIQNTLRLVRTGGHVILYEPLYGPAYAMATVFYAKKCVTKFTSKRVTFFKNCNNIGQPVVSYLNQRQVLHILESTGECEISKMHLDPQKPTWLMRMVGIRTWLDSCFVLRKTDTADRTKANRAA